MWQKGLRDILYHRVIKFLIMMPVALWVSGLAICHGEVLNCSIVPQPRNNFLEASFRLVNPDPGKTPEAILVYISGTDSDARWVVDNPQFLATSKACHAALLGCYFRGEDLSYDLPGEGSGRALDEALAHFAEQSHLPGLAKAPLLLFGYSQGAQFAFNYLCWRPDRIKAFAVLRPGNFQLRPQEISYAIPGLIAAGENDESGRIRTAARGFSYAVGKHSNWSFLFERNAGHEMAGSSDFARQFFEAVCSDMPLKSPVGMSLETGGSMNLNESTEDLCWFPDQTTVDTWLRLHKTAKLKDLCILPEQADMNEFVKAVLTSDNFVSENNSSQSGLLDLTSVHKGFKINSVHVTGPGFVLESVKNGNLEYKVTFAPRAMDWGRVAGNIFVDGELDGRRLESMEINLSGTVKGPLTPLPSMVYFGAAQRGQRIARILHVKVGQAFTHINQILSPRDIQVTLTADSRISNELQLKLVWTAGERLGRMTDEIRLNVDAPQKGTLRIPVLGIIFPSGSEQ